MSDEQAIALGLDLGGTACKLGIFDIASGDLLEQISSPIKDGKRLGQDLFEQFCDGAEGMLKSQGLDTAQVTSTCVASAGILGPDGAREPNEFDGVVNSPNIPGLHDFNMREALNARFPHARVFVENDAKAAGWAEWFYGAGKDDDVHSLVGFTLGTGLGGYIIVNGKMVRPGELGHTRLDSSEEAPFCPCGVRGCAEAFVSKVAIRRIGSEVLADFPKSKLKQIGKSPEGFDPLPIAKAADEGDEGCICLYHRVGRSLGKLIWNVKRICQPDVVACAGNIANALHLMLPGIREVLAEDTLLPKQPVVKKSDLGPGQAGVIGAGALAIYGREILG